MVFSSFTFLLLFMPAVILLTTAVRGIRAKNIVLCLFSLLFYAWGEPIYILLMLGSILINYLIGLGMASRPNKKKILMILATVINIGAIVLFKYLDMLLSACNSFFGTQIPLAGITLPIGISFYTFQILSYVIDVYHEKTEPQRNLLTLATYISMFPQLVAGPIVRYESVREQLNNRQVTLEVFSAGLSRTILGLGKKVLLANQMALAADQIFSNISNTPAAVLWFGAVCYALQIYFDFSGYSDMAIGMGHMFGFTFSENFNMPYLANSITDFWRRWHISLSSWFREYVYIPLGGNRRGPYRQILNLLIVWILTGLWHGASWNYALWGLYYCILLILEKFVLGSHIKHIPPFFRHLGTLFLVLIGWIIFRVEDIGMLGSIFTRIFSFSTTGTVRWFLSNAAALQSLFILPVAIIACLPIRQLIRTQFGNSRYLTYASRTWVFLVWLLSIAMLLGESYNPFIYFRF